MYASTPHHRDLDRSGAEPCRTYLPSNAGSGERRRGNEYMVTLANIRLTTRFALPYRAARSLGHIGG
jgi:hypothetical protein